MSVRAVLDANVLVSALLGSAGVPAQVLRRGIAGEFEIVVSDQLLDELARVLRYPKLRRRIPPDDAAAVMRVFRHAGTLVADPAGPHHVRAADPDDDYLIALAAVAGAALVSGDRHLLALADVAPVHDPAGFLAILDGR